MSSSATAVTLNFASTVGTSVANDVVVLTVTAGKEEAAMEKIADAMSSERAMTVVADDQNGKYLINEVTAVASISVDSGAGTFKNFITGAFTSNDLALTTAQSGSLISIPANGTTASTITLPTAPPAGTNYTFVAVADNGNAATTIAGSFDGVLSDGGDNTSVTGTTAAVIVASKFKKGDIIKIVFSAVSSKYFLEAILKTADGVTVS
tara:strand:- start:61 stop:684 length:624 start_codon:yes stop_codon:yes gene_type:complete